MLAFYDFPTQTNMPIRIGQRLGKQLSKSLFEDQSISFDSLYAFSHLAFFSMIDCKLLFLLSSLALFRTQGGTQKKALLTRVNSSKAGKAGTQLKIHLFPKQDDDKSTYSWTKMEVLEEKFEEKNPDEATVTIGM